jgi:hypothetical protein
MKSIMFLLVGTISIVIIGSYCESKMDPYEEGMHWDYSVECENGFVYKVLSHRRGTIQVLNSDGTPLKCGDKIH